MAVDGKYEYKYQWVNIHGLDFIKTCFHEVGKGNAKRRKFKDLLGESNYYTIMLDSCGPNLCDAIIITKDVKNWISTLNNKYTATVPPNP